MSADGYPFDPDSQRIARNTLRLKLTPVQIQQISATGTLTFSEANLQLIRHYYPAATNRVDVITTTFNDNNEQLTPEDVFCFWAAPDEVAITLDHDHPKDKSPFATPTHDIFPTDEELKTAVSRQIRLSPEGSIFFRGKSITLKQAFSLIDDIAHLAKPAKDHVTGEPDRWLIVVVPPPLSALDSLGNNSERPTVQQIFDALKAYGAANSVEVGRRW